MSRSDPAKGAPNRKPPWKRLIALHQGTASTMALAGSIARMRSTLQRAQSLLKRKSAAQSRTETSQERDARSRLRDELKKRP